jgi:hypothetical protein
MILLYVNDAPQAPPVKEGRRFFKFVDSDGSLLVNYTIYGVLILVYIDQ